ncbi:hypothetical protein Tco_1185756 [Tanacetum coccineum]
MYQKSKGCLATKFKHTEHAFVSFFRVTTIRALIDTVNCVLMIVYYCSTQVNNAYSTNIDELRVMMLFEKAYINGNMAIGFDKSKAECYKECHKTGLILLGNLVVAVMAGGYDWSDQEEDGPYYSSALN